MRTRFVKLVSITTCMCHCFKYSILGVILFSESDLHHADFWCKSNDPEDVLPQFQKSWRLDRCSVCL